MDQRDELQLVEAVMAGDRAALGQLLSMHHRRMYNIVLRMVSNADDAAEVTQDAMLKVVEHIGDFHGDSKITTWMTRIAMNLAISHLRKRKLRKTISLDTPPGTPGSPAPGSGPGSSRGRAGHGGGDDQSSALRRQLADSREPGPLRRVQQQEMIEHLYRALDGLDEQFRAVLVLRDIDQMDYKQVAAVVGIPVGTVKSRLFRARLALRQEMTRLDAAALMTPTKQTEP